LWELFLKVEKYEEIVDFSTSEEHVQRQRLVQFGGGCSGDRVRLSCGAEEKGATLPSLSSELLTRAVGIYLEQAYPGGNVPGNRSHFVGWSESSPLDELLKTKGIERPAENGPSQTIRCALRVGNQWYPHMKILVCSVGTEDDIIFAVDTHDQLKLPPGSPEEAMFRELQARNQQLARHVENLWEQSGVPTQAGVLRQYLANARPPRPEG